MRYKTLASCATTGLLVAIAGCGDSDSKPGSAGPNGVHAIVRVTPETAGKNCVAGGSLVEYGRDVNANDQLDTAEIGGKQFVCNGTAGVAGKNGTDGKAGVGAINGALSAVSVRPEPAGANCVTGGSRIDIGTDADADGLPDADAVLSTSFVCDGTSAQSGIDGQPLLFSVSEEAAGSNCRDGGKRVVYGLDADGNGFLAAIEVLGTSYVCHGNPFGNGSRGLVDVTAVAAGQPCAAGGDRIDYGQDQNQDGTLDTSEITGTRYVCTGAPGANATLPLVAISTEAAGSNCFGGGKRVDVGSDTDGDQTLDTAEITQTRYVCNGTNGTNGTSGTSGKTSLVDATVEAAGTNCTSGGYKLASGFDANGNGALDGSEISSTTYLCNGNAGTAGSDASSHTGLVRVTAEPAGAACAAGGKRVESGIDDDASGSLDPSEVDDTDFICDGANGSNGNAGADGTQSLVNLTPEVAGPNCAAGGQRVDVGLDADRSGTLGSSEISSTRYVCNAANGTNGTNGLDAARALVAISAEAAGVNCATGGQRVSYGLDDSGDGTLGAGEVDGTRFVCNGAAGTNGTNGTSAVNSLVSVVTEAAGMNCTSGGQRITYGLDDNGDATLAAGEIDGTRYVCSGANGTNGSNATDAVNSLVNVTIEPVGLNCASGGQLISYGLDDDGDGTLAVGEIDGTRYVCSGANGTNGTNNTSNGAVTLVNISTEPVGVNCPGAGHKIQVGLDDDASGALDVGEIDSTSYVCDFAVIVNGSFETGNYFGWTFQLAGIAGIWANLANNTLVSSGNSLFDYRTNANRTVNSLGLPFTYTASQGTRVATVFQAGGATQRIYQTVTVPPTASTLNWDMSYQSFAAFSATTQFVAVYLRNPTNDAIVATLYKTATGDPTSVTSMTAFSASVVAYQGQTLRLDVTSEVRVNYFPAAFDNFRFQ